MFPLTNAFSKLIILFTKPQEYVSYKFQSHKICCYPDTMRNPHTYTHAFSSVGVGVGRDKKTPLTSMLHVTMKNVSTLKTD